MQSVVIQKCKEIRKTKNRKTKIADRGIAWMGLPKAYDLKVKNCEQNKVDIGSNPITRTSVVMPIDTHGSAQLCHCAVS